jgi:hypothetical protein
MLQFFSRRQSALPARLHTRGTSPLSFIYALIIGLSATALRAPAQTTPSLPTDRARITVASISDAYDLAGPQLKVLRTDVDTPLRAGTVWIWNETPQEQPAAYYDQLKDAGLNAVRMILFDTWMHDNAYTTVRWTDSAYREAILARIDRAVDYASARGLYVIINSHNGYGLYDATWVDELWTVVAPRYAGRTHVIYEAANEPMTNLGDNGDISALVPGRLAALRATHDLIRAAAPATHIMVLSPANVLSDTAAVTALGNLAQNFADLPGPAIDWSKTSVAYHLYAGHTYSFPQAQDLRDLHARFPGWPSENNFPAAITSETLGITDPVRSIAYQDHEYINQTSEFLGTGWSMWNINGVTQFANNWPLIWADAVAKGYSWQPDPTTPPSFTSTLSAEFLQGAYPDYQLTAAPGPIGFTATGLPAGLTLDYNTGRLMGYARTPGRYRAQVTAANAHGNITAPLELSILPTAFTVNYSVTFAPATAPWATFNWFSYASPGATQTRANVADPTASDGRAFQLTVTSPSASWYGGCGLNFDQAAPFTAATLAQFTLRGRLKVSSPATGPNSEKVRLILKTGNGHALNYRLNATEDQWIEFSVPLDAFSDDAFEYSAPAWQILVIPDASDWGSGTSTLTLDTLELVRIEPITDPLIHWRLYHFNSNALLPESALEADADGDGYINFYEYALGGDPTDPTSYPPNTLPEAVLDETTGATHLRYAFTPQQLSDIAYTIESSSDLQSWTTFTPPAGDLILGQPYSYADPVNLQDPATPNRFLRLRLTYSE